eukprot:1117677-Amphidinium_carterae.1
MTSVRLGDPFVAPYRKLEDAPPDQYHENGELYKKGVFTNIHDARDLFSNIVQSSKDTKFKL